MRTLSSPSRASAMRRRVATNCAVLMLRSTSRSDMAASLCKVTARAATGLISRAEVRLGPSVGRSEAEAVPGALRAPSDTATGGPRRASAREIKPVAALIATRRDLGGDRIEPAGRVQQLQVGDPQVDL